MTISVKKFMELVRSSDSKGGVEPQSRTEISSTHLVTGPRMTCCLPRVITAFW